MNVHWAIHWCVHKLFGTYHHRQQLRIKLHYSREFDQLQIQTCKLAEQLFKSQDRTAAWHQDQTCASSLWDDFRNIIYICPHGHGQTWDRQWYSRPKNVRMHIGCADIASALQPSSHPSQKHTWTGCLWGCCPIWRSASCPSLLRPQ